MSITKELRDCIRTASRSYEDVRNPYNDREILHIPEEELLAIADRIDAEHESACAEAYGNGVMSVPIALDESQWVQLPKDADGEVIHFGDMLSQFGVPMSVFAISDPDPDQGDCMICLTDSLGNDEWVRARKMRHHHAPTVEDVLREFAAKLCIRDGFTEATEETFAEYASKLRLAGDAE